MQRGCQRAGRGQRGAGGGTKQVEWNRAAVSAGQGEGVSVEVAREQGGGKVVQRGCQRAQGAEWSRWSGTGRQ